MSFHFDPDALLAALPRRPLRPVQSSLVTRSTSRPSVPDRSALLLDGSYNGFTARERSRTAELSKWLAKVGSTERPVACEICGAAADDEHAEDYYNLASWIGLCRRCHRTALHGRFTRAERWAALLDEQEVPEGHWSRLVSHEPFDLAALQRSRGVREPIRADFATNTK